MHKTIFVIPYTKKHLTLMYNNNSTLNKNISYKLFFLITSYKIY